MIEGDDQSLAQILGADLLLDAVRAAVKAAFAPTREIERRFAQGLRRDRARVHGNAADAFALFDDENLLAELGGLDGATAAGGSASDDDEIELVHGHFRKKGRIVVRCEKSRSHASISSIAQFDEVVFVFETCWVRI